MQWKTIYPLFQHARAAMFIDATNFLTHFKDPSQSRVVDQVAVAPLPAGPGRSIYHSDVYTRSVPPDMIQATKQEIPNAVPNGANPLVVPLPEVRAAIGQAIVAALQGGDAEKAANAARRTLHRLIVAHAAVHRAWRRLEHPRRSCSATSCAAWCPAR